MRTSAWVPCYGAGEERAHALTHGVGLLASVAGLAILVVAASLRGNALHVAACSVFGATLVLLYAASTFYHGLRSPRAKRVLQRLDHASIFLLIAGTYTPFTLVTLRGSLGFALLAAVWALAILGIALEAALPRWPRRLSLGLHLLMGWLVVVSIGPLVHALHPSGLTLLVVGGAAYTLGVPIYAWKRLPYNHAVWHVFVLAGSACHYSCVLGYVIPPAS